MEVKCVYTVYNVFYAVYTVYTVYTVCIVTLLPPHTVYTICTIWTALYCSNTSMNADIYIVIKLKGYWMLEYGFKGFGGRNGMEWMGQWIRKIASLLTTWEPGVLKTSTCCYHCLMSDWCPLFVANIFRQGHFGHFVTSSSRFSKISRQVTVEASQNNVVCSACLSSSWR